jgi:ABC-type nickel/cobalt efflux system permease component RcnA
MQLIGIACLHSPLAPNKPSKSLRETMANISLRITIAAGIVPCWTFLLYIAVEIFGTGPINEILEVPLNLLVGVGIPVAALALLAALVLQVVGRFSFIATYTQSVSILSTTWPYLYYAFLH